MQPAVICPSFLKSAGQTHRRTWQSHPHCSTSHEPWASIQVTLWKHSSMYTKQPGVHCEKEGGTQLHCSNTDKGKHSHSTHPRFHAHGLSRDHSEETTVFLFLTTDQLSCTRSKTFLTPLQFSNRRFPEITGVFLLRESEVPWMEAAAEKSRSATVLDLLAWTYYNLY